MVPNKKYFPIGTHHYDYTRLDSFLTQDPKELGDKLVTIMARLVTHMKLNEDYHKQIEEDKKI